MATLQSVTVSDTGFVKLPIGTTAQRSGSPSAGMIRFNSDMDTFEFYDGTDWKTSLADDLDVDIGNMTLYLDSNKERSRIKKSDHGVSHWICMDTGTASYATIYPGTVIYQVDTSGVETTVVSATAGPAMGTFAMTQSYSYYSNRPIHLMQSGAGSRLVPMSLSGRTFGNYNNRYNSSIYYFYCPVAATVTVYDNVATGINGTATTTVALTAGTVATHTTATESAWVFFTADQDIVMSVRETDGGDYHIMPPASPAMYTRANEYVSTVINGTPSTNNTYYVADSSPVVAMQIADGAGGDSAQGLSLEHLSTNYCVGTGVSNFIIVSPYNQTVTARSWNGSSWTTYNTYALAGTLTSPASTGEIGAAAGSGTDLSGAHALWHFYADQPFFVHINDLSSDEEILLGWNKERTKRHHGDREGHVWKNLLGADNNAIVRGAQFQDSSTPKYWTFDGTNDYMYLTDLNYGPSNTISEMTVLAWVRTSQDTGTLDAWDNGNWSILDFDRSEVFTFTVNGKGQIEMSGATNTGDVGVAGAGGSDTYFDMIGNAQFNDGNWHLLGWTYSVTNKQVIMYGDGEIDKTHTSSASFTALGTSRTTRYGIIGDGSESSAEGNSLNGIYFDGDIGAIMFWDSTVLSPGQIRRIWQQQRGTYGV